uniref:Chromosome 16 open reading frame 78 n=1 Tax=Mustela putorius furo TaxID=9669 RepID=M3XVD6_MUSPF
MMEKSEHLKSAMPTERKSAWRTIEERRMSDLTRVLEWLERRKGKKKQMQKPKGVTSPKTNGKEGRKDLNILKQQKGNRQVAFAKQCAKKDGDPTVHGKIYGSVDPKGNRLSIIPSSYTRDGPRKSGKKSASRQTENQVYLDIKDAIALESIQRSLQYHRQSVLDPLLQETPVFGRRSTLLRDLVLGRSTEISYERKLKSLMEKGAEPKVELVRMLKPEEVLSCRYLRLSKNNIRTLLKLCKDAGMNVDIHPHMVEGEIDAKKVFNQNPSVAL